MRSRTRCIARRLGQCWRYRLPALPPGLHLAAVEPQEVEALPPIPARRPPGSSSGWSVSPRRVEDQPHPPERLRGPAPSVLHSMTTVVGVPDQLARAGGSGPPRADPARGAPHSPATARSPHPGGRPGRWEATSPSSSTPASSHCRSSFSIRRSLIRFATSFMSSVVVDSVEERLDVGVHHPVRTAIHRPDGPAPPLGAHSASAGTRTSCPESRPRRSAPAPPSRQPGPPDPGPSESPARAGFPSAFGISTRRTARGR